MVSSQVKPQEAKEVKAAKPSSAKKESIHPKYVTMVVDAVSSLKERNGSTIVMIRNQIAKDHPGLPGLDKKIYNNVKQAVAKLTVDNKLVEFRKQETSKPRFKLSDSTKKELKIAVTPKKSSYLFSCSV